MPFIPVFFFFFHAMGNLLPMLISPLPVRQGTKMNKARGFQPQRKATAEHPMGLLPVGPQCKGGWLGGVFTAAAPQSMALPSFCPLCH